MASRSTTLRVVPHCFSCHSDRIGFDYGNDGDDEQPSVAVRCSACGAKGPIAEGRHITDAMVRACAEGWNQIWENFGRRPRRVRVDLVGDREVWHREPLAPSGDQFAAMRETFEGRAS